MSKHTSRLRRALRLADRLTLLTLNSPSPYDTTPYTNQMRRTVSSPRVF